MDRIAPATVADLIREIRKPGPVLVEVLTQHDTLNVEVVKVDLCFRLHNAYSASAPSPYTIAVSETGTRFLEPTY